MSVLCFQEKVLHNIMPIFTFMGANIMRLDDAYSFRVIDKTVQMVIPALIQVRNGEVGFARSGPLGMGSKIKTNRLTAGLQRD